MARTGRGAGRGGHVTLKRAQGGVQRVGGRLAPTRPASSHTRPQLDLPVRTLPAPAPTHHHHHRTRPTRRPQPPHPAARFCGIDPRAGPTTAPETTLKRRAGSDSNPRPPGSNRRGGWSRPAAGQASAEALAAVRSALSLATDRTQPSNGFGTTDTPWMRIWVFYIILSTHDVNTWPIFDFFKNRFFGVPPPCAVTWGPPARAGSARASPVETGCAPDSEPK